MCLLISINVAPKSPSCLPSHGPVLGHDLEPDVWFWFGIHMPGERFPTDRAVMVMALEHGNASCACFPCVRLPVYAQRCGRVSWCKTDAAVEHHIHLSPYMTLLNSIGLSTAGHSRACTSSPHVERACAPIVHEFRGTPARRRICRWRPGARPTSVPSRS